MKYIVFQLESEGRDTILTAVQFDDLMAHKDVAEMIENVKVQPEGPCSNWWMWPKPVSAGFLLDGVVCTGYSESLGLKSHPDDTDICKRGSVTCGNRFKPRPTPTPEPERTR